jgi:hypothetical protein
MFFNNIWWSSHHWEASSLATCSKCASSHIWTWCPCWSPKMHLIPVEAWPLVGTGCLWQPWRRQQHFLCEPGSCQTYLCQCWRSVTGCCWWQFPQLVWGRLVIDSSVASLYHLLMACCHSTCFGCCQ